jgi:hypothetical protein
MDFLTTAAYLAFIGVEITKLPSSKEEGRAVTKWADNVRNAPTTNMVVQTMNLQCQRSCCSEVRSVKKITRSQNTKKHSFDWQRGKAVNDGYK